MHLPKLLVSGALACVTVFGASAILTGTTPDAQAMAYQPGNDKVRVRLLSEHSHLIAGQTNYLALMLDVSKDWHIYWRNPGGAIPTSWQLTDAPEGVTLGDEAIWPAPERYPTDFGLDFVYEGRVIILVPVEVDSTLAGQTIELDLRADWLVCKDICVPGNGTASLKIPVTTKADEAQATRTTRLFERARATAPQPLEDLEAAGISAGWSGKTLNISANGASAVAFYPYENDADVYPDDTKADTESPFGNTLTIGYAKTDDASFIALGELRGLLRITKGSDVSFHEIAIPVR